MSSLIQNQLIAHAEWQMANCSQYENLFKKYNLVQLRKGIKTKMGQAFVANELAIAAPTIFNRIDEKGQLHQSVSVWSISNKCNTRVPLSSVLLRNGSFSVIHE